MGKSSKLLRQQRLAEGLCMYCGKAPKVKNKVGCEKCLDHKREESKLRRAKKKQGNICLDCSKPAVEGKSRCETHLKNHKQQLDDKRKVLVEQFNFCIDCCSEPALEGYSLCKRCIEKQSKGEINWGTVFDNSSEKEIMVKNDLRGRQFGYLTVVDYSYKKKTNHFWLCSCECGEMHLAQQTNLLSGQVYSCGCKNKWKENENKAKRLKRAERLANGLCSKCGLHPFVENKTFCEKCLIEKREYSKRVREEKKANGECKFCKNKAIEGKNVCPKCYNKQNDYYKGKREQKKELKICVDCKEPAEEGHIYCSYHLGLKRFRKALAKEKLNEN